jgi:hypothetical protein
MSELQEAVGGASKTSDGEDVKGVVRQNQDGTAEPKTKEERKKLEFRTMEDGRVVRRQPQATRHLDPAETGALDPSGAPVDMVDRKRYKLRAKYTFLYGKDLAYKGPIILWLTDEEVKGQEHKLELLEGEAVTTRKDITPPSVRENADVETLKRKFAELMSHAEAIKAEIWSLQKRDEERARKDEIRSTSRPPVPKVAEPKKAKTNPEPKPLEEFVPGQPGRRQRPKIKLPDAGEGVDLTAPPPNVSRPPAG